jgi:hypothetical protein
VEVNRTVLMPPDLHANAQEIEHVAQWQPAMHSFHSATDQTYLLIMELRSLCNLEEVSATKNQSRQPTNMAWS